MAKSCARVYDHSQKERKLPTLIGSEGERWDGIYMFLHSVPNWSVL